MAIDDVTREGVLKAMAEHDRVGETPFLSQYGFKRATIHFVIHEGQVYSSKAVLGVGQKYSMAKNNIPKKLNNFYGGTPTINRLKQLGFEDFTSSIEGVTTYIEGEKYRREVELFRRNPEIVKKAKEKYGYRCQACDFDFKEFYGPLGKEYIECHHLKPLAENGRETKTSLEDVTVLCSNCHRMVHRKKKALSIRQLQNKIRKTRK